MQPGLDFQLSWNRIAPIGLHIIYINGIYACRYFHAIVTPAIDVNLFNECLMVGIINHNLPLLIDFRRRGLPDFLWQARADIYFSFKDTGPDSGTIVASSHSQPSRYRYQGKNKR